MQHAHAHRHQTLVMNSGKSALAFFAPLISSLTPRKGSLNIFDRGDTDATVTDFEGLVRNTLANESRFIGARRVENISPNINNQDGSYTDGGVGIWSVNDDLEAVYTFTTLGLSLSGTRSILNFIAIGEDVTNQIEFKIINLPVGGLVKLYDGISTAALTTIGDENTAKNVWHRASSAQGRTVTLLGTIGVLIKEGSVAGLPIEVHFRKVQYEYSIGQVNQNPSEFVSVGVGTESESNADPDIEDPTKWEDDQLSSTAKGIISGGQLTINVPSGTTSGTGWIHTIANVGDVGELTHARLYEHTVVVSAFNVSRPGADYRILNGWAGDDDLPITGVGTFTKVMRNNRAGGSGDEVGAWIRVVNGASGLTDQVVIDSYSIKEVAHGANVDGVKYFSTDNYNSVTSNVVTANPLLISVSDGIQQLVEPDFNTDRIDLVGSPDFTSSTTSKPDISGGVIIHDSFSELSGILVLEVGKFYLLEYEVLVNNYPTNGINFGGHEPSVSVGIYKNVYLATSTSSFSAFSVIAGSSLGFVRVTPLGAIPDANLKGFLPEEVSTNNMTVQDMDNGTNWAYTNSAIASNIIEGSLQWYEFDEQNTATVEHYFQPKNLKWPLVGISETYVVSYHCKYVDMRYIRLELTDDATVPVTGYVDFDLLNGTIKATSIATGYINTIGNTIIISAKLTSGTDATATKPRIYALDAAGTVTTFTGTNRTLLIAAMQLEIRSTPTSYIPTVSGTVTRDVETLEYAFPSKFNGNSIDVNLSGRFTIPYNGIDITNDAYILHLGSLTDSITVFILASDGKLRVRLTTNSLTYDIDSLSAIVSGTYDWAISYDNTTKILTLVLAGVDQGDTGIAVAELDFTRAAAALSLFIGSNRLETNQSNFPIRSIL